LTVKSIGITRFEMSYKLGDGDIIIVLCVMGYWYHAVTNKLQ